MKYRHILICLLAASILPSLALGKEGKEPKQGKGFGKLDSNGDELISLEEAQSAGADKIVEHFNEIDTDGSGGVSKEELRKHHQQRKGEPGGKGERGAKLKEMDTDGNGAISFEEATKADAKKLVEHFKKLDANGDGEIDRKEMKKMKEMRKPAQKEKKNNDEN